MIDNFYGFAFYAPEYLYDNIYLEGGLSSNPSDDYIVDSSDRLDEWLDYWWIHKQEFYDSTDEWFEGLNAN